MKKILTGSCLLILATCINAQKFEQLTKLVAGDRAPNTQLGNAVAVSGNYAVIGAAGVIEQGLPGNCNCAYVFEKTNGNWIQKQKLSASDKTSGNDFGHSVSISGNTIIIGAPNDESNAGAAYIFERNSAGNWLQVKKIVAPDRSAGDLFGTSVSIITNYAVVGAPGDGDFAAGWPQLPGAGSAYFFTNLNGSWEILNKAGPWVGTFNDRSQGAGFGYSVAISGVTTQGIYAVIGAPYEKKDTTGSNPLDGAGAAYVFERNLNGGMELVHKITDWSRAPMDNFGYSVAINGNTILVGSPSEDDDLNMENPVNNAGSVHVFEKKADDRWWWVQKIIANDRAVGDNFGHSVSLSGNTAIIGSVAADDGSLSGTGAAYIFLYDADRYGWTTTQIKIVAGDRAAGDWFGNSVAVDGDNILIGAPLQDKNTTGIEATDAGAVYVFGKAICSVGTSSVSATACKNYTSPSRKYTWTKTGTYKDTVLNKAGCDSIITVNLTITGRADTSVTVKGHTLTANAKDANYSWIDCATNQPININTRTLIVTVSGSYKVSIDQDGCVGTSSCHKVVLISSIDSSKNTNPPTTILPHNKANLKAFLEVNKIVAKDRTHNDAFGTSVSISGNYAVIGAPSDDDDEKGGSVLGAGSAYIFRLDDGGKWKQMQKISAFDRIPGAAFGCSVGISGNYLVVGANRDNLGVNGLYDSYLAGSAYVFQLVNGTWSFQQKIIANPTARVQQGQAFFGSSVAIDGTTIVIGCPDHQLDPTDQVGSSVSSAGALFVYQLTAQKITQGGTEKTINGWVQTQKLVAKDRIIGNNLGNSVAICGDNIIAGSWGNDYDAMNANRMEAAGAAYIFERQGGLWVQTQKLVAEDRSPYDEFGCSVGISGDYAVVGARRVTLNKGDDGMDDYTGNAYIFKRNSSGVGWSQQMKINPDDRTKWDYLGSAVGISGDYLIVGAWGQDTDSLGNYMADAGAVYVYYLNKQGNWIQSDKVSPFYKHQLGHFGGVAAISDCNIIATSSTDQTDEDDNNAISGTGAAYIFTAAGCNNNGRCNAPSLPQNKIPKLINSDSEKIKKYQSPNLNGKGNDQKIDTINIKNEEPSQATIINSPNPKIDEVKTNGPNYDFSKVEMCIDQIEQHDLPPKTSTTFYAEIPSIKADGELGDVASIKQELTAITEKMWSPGELLTVGFFPTKQFAWMVDAIKKYAPYWEGIANIKFSFISDVKNAQIKVTFNETDGTSWSKIGRDLIFNPFNDPTMTYGMIGFSTVEDMRGTILHEFGHALGFIHEHQSPTSAGIAWDKEKAYSYFGRPPGGWDRAMVDEHVFKKYSQTITNSSVYDRKSIMHYFFPAYLTTDGSSFSKNTMFSAIDSEYARSVYPFPPSPKNSSGVLHTKDDCDEIVFTVDYKASGVADYEVEFVLEPGIDPTGNWVTWWKKIGIPLKGGGEAGLEIVDKSVSDRKIGMALIDKSRGISFWKAKFLGVHTLLDYKWNVLPAIIGGCRVRLTWKQDRCY